MIKNIVDIKMTQFTKLNIAKRFIAFSAILITAHAVTAQDATVDTELLAQGEEVYNTIAGIGCKGCHGEYAEGDLGVGPFTRGANEGMVSAAVSGIGEMVVVKNIITDEQVTAVSAYLNYLGTAQVARSLVKRGRFLPEVFSARPGTRLQVILQNGGFEAHTFKSDNMDIDDIEIAARTSGNLIWEAPEQEGTYSLYCTDCKLDEQYFTININASAPEFRKVTPGIVSKGAQAGLYLYE